MCFCQTHLGCKAKSVRQELIEKEILERVVSEIFTEKNIELIAKLIANLSKKENAAILLLKKQYDCVIKNIRNIIGAIANGIYTDSVKEKLLFRNCKKKKPKLKSQFL